MGNIVQNFRHKISLLPILLHSIILSDHFNRYICALLLPLRFSTALHSLFGLTFPFGRPPAYRFGSIRLRFSSERRRKQRRKENAFHFDRMKS